jgi:tetratricopeptide (TPR) repeat protein
MRSSWHTSNPSSRLQASFWSCAQPRSSTRALVLTLALGASLTACAAAAHTAARPTTPLSVPDDLDEAAYGKAQRAYLRLAPDDPQRPGVREKLVHHRIVQALRARDAEEYERVVDELAQVSALYRPEELAKGLPKEIEPVADYLKITGEKRGDEARVQSALWIKMQLHPEDAQLKEQYQTLRRWSDEARQNLGGVTEHLNGLIEVLAEHARLTPAPDILATLADLYVERRRQLVLAFGPDGESRVNPGELTYQDYREASQALNRAPLDIAGVYLVHQDFTHALERLRTLESVTGLEPRLRATLERAITEESDAPVSVLALSRKYLESGDAAVSRALCLYGVRTFVKDAAFPQCLARVAALADDYAEATAEYAEAIALAPDQRELYDEALEVLANLMRGEMFDSDPSETRALAGEARNILDERVKRWPEIEPPVAFEDLELAVGLAEMSAGNADEARSRLEASVAKKETTRALIQLGQLAARTGQLDQAEKYLRRALDRSSTRDLDEARMRAQILEQLGDVQRATHAFDNAKRSYGEALTLWQGEAQMGTDAPQKAFAHIRRGILLSRLAREPESRDAFEAAMQVAPDNRETYAQILAHLVVSAPELEFADTILRRAQRQLTLDPEWKTYFALWVKAIGGRSHQPVSADVEHLLQRLARSDAWWGHLAQFGLGSIDYAKLSSFAHSRGEHTEADFYEGVRRLAAGDLAGARELFKRVISAHMVGFYEYQMAQELLLLEDQQLTQTNEAAPPATATAATAAPAKPAAPKF